MRATGPRERLLAFLTADGGGATMALIEGLPIALGWATVELGRAGLRWN